MGLVQVVVLRRFGKKSRFGTMYRGWSSIWGARYAATLQVPTIIRLVHPVLFFTVRGRALVSYPLSQEDDKGHKGGRRVVKDQKGTI